MYLPKTNLSPILIGLLFMVFVSCKDDQESLPTIELGKSIPGCTNPLSDSYNPDATTNDESCAPTDCAKCDHFIAGDDFRFNGLTNNVQPGDIICLDATVQYDFPIALDSIYGSESNPVLIVNCGGQATITREKESSYSIRTNNCKYFRLSGTGSNDFEYGIKVDGSHLGVQLDVLSTNFEVDHLEISDIGFAGIMAKTDPTCDEATQRGNFTMTDISIHDNYIHDTSGEGMYIGNSFYVKGMNRDDCGTVYPHDIKNADIYNNRVINAGWEAIQVGCGVENVQIHHNYVSNYGTVDRTFQNNGIQVGEGTGGLLYNNYIEKGPGAGIIMLGLGDNIVFNNIIIEAGSFGVFCDERYSPGPGFSFINNTIINPKSDGIRIYAEKVDLNHIKNNIIINPGSYGELGEDAYVKTLNDEVNIDMKNNHFSLDINTVLFESGSYQLSDESPLIDTGSDATDYGVTFDFNDQDRPLGAGFDIGAYESN
ncbi:MAG: right-handed parallel beta-helix repeat-containing protein [Reichenbachiella sp.]